MLIIPIERKIDWRKPPIVTTLLVIINLLIFFLYQMQDATRLENAADFYLKEELFKMEFAFYPTHLGSNRQTELAQKVRQDYQQGRYAEIAHNMMLDRSFAEELQRRKTDFFNPAELKIWEPRRAAFDVLIKKVSSIGWGLIPAEHRPLTFITYQFLHAGFLHLFFNMLFLFILGFTVEAGLGYWKFPLAYLITGIAGGLLHSFIFADSYQPLVGASAAISGVMGMYAALFGMRKIQFFYWIGPYFDYIKLPALLILLVWFVEQISYHYLSHDNVAYLAHAGGLAAGAIIIFAGRKSLLGKEEDYFEIEELEPDIELREALADAYDQLGKFNFDGAKKRFYALKEKYPNNFDVLERLFHLEKLTPTTQAFHQRANDLFAVAVSSSAQLKGTYLAYKDYAKHCAEELTLNATQIANLTIKFAKIHELTEAEKMIQKAIDQQLRHPMLMKAALVLAREFEQNEQSQKAKRLRELANYLVETPPA